MSKEHVDRRYSLAPIDRTGVMFGLDGSQVGVLIVGLFGATFMLIGGASLQWPLLWVVLSVGLATAPTGGIPAVQQIPVLVRFVKSRPPKRRSWVAPVPLLEVISPSSPSPGTTGAPNKRSRVALPKAMEKQELLAVDPSGLGFLGRTAPVAVVWDRVCGTLAATIRVTGSGFALAEAGEQDRMLAGWGEALASFVREGTPVVQVRWSEWAAPAPAAQHRNWIAEHLSPNPDAGAIAAYEQLVSASGPLGTRHEVLLTVVVSMQSVRQPKQRRISTRVETAVEACLMHTRLFADRLEMLGLIVSGPLTPGELGESIRARLDPSCIPVMDRLSRTIGERTGVVSPSNLGPLSARNEWTWFQADTAYHRAYVVAEWPRTPVPASWMRPVLTSASDEPRTFTTFLEPIPAKVSRRAIDRSLAKIDSDSEQKQKAGFRIGAAQRRQRNAIEDREEELVSGHPEFGFSGIVIVTGKTLESLERNGEQVQQAAAQAGIELRELHGRHDQAVTASLPMARSLISKKWW
jgi:hypothetical protein